MKSLEELESVVTAQGRPRTLGGTEARLMKTGLSWLLRGVTIIDYVITETGGSLQKELKRARGLLANSHKNFDQVNDRLGKFIGEQG